ncbi:hypothetical protein FRB91_011306 [Serendipita sp. 411]|nr:hypothetical protein FRB91_011306 [Serendipita sp. 411]
MSDAPFVIRPLSVQTSSGPQNEAASQLQSRNTRRQSRLGSSIGTVIGQPKIDGSIHWNQQVASNGLVCGSSSKELLRTVIQMVKVHLQDGPSSSTLIFHASTRDNLVSSHQVSTVQFAKRLPTPSIFLAPRPRKSVKELYTMVPLEPHNILPLRFAERDISLAHVLSLCTPPEDYPNRERILTSVQYIVSRLADPFSVQEFNQFVDEEQWDSHGSAFMAIRQTLLTTLIMTGDEATSGDIDVVTRMRGGGAIVVDLSDPVLKSTGIDSILFDMILCLYCSVQRDANKLLVLDQAHEYLSTNPALLNTLVTLFSMHADSPIKTLISSSDLTLISPRLLSHLDYLICHDSQSPAWLEYIRSNIACNVSSPPSPSGDPGSHMIHNLEARQAMIISPRSIFQSSSTPGNEPVGERWGSKSYLVELGWDAPLTLEQKRIEQLEALVAQLSSTTAAAAKASKQGAGTASVNGGGTVTSRRTRKESSIYMENTINALRNALGYLASRKALESPSPVPSPPLSPQLPLSPREPKQLTPVIEEKTSDSDAKKTHDSGAKKEITGIVPLPSETESPSDGSAWKIKPVSPAELFTFPVMRHTNDLGPFDDSAALSTEPDTDVLRELLSQAVIDAGGELGQPISSHKVADAFRSANGHREIGLPTWMATTSFAEKHGIIVFVDKEGGKHEWLVVSKPIDAPLAQHDPPPPKELVSQAEAYKIQNQANYATGGPQEENSLSVVQSPDGWYEVQSEALSSPPVIIPIISEPQPRISTNGIVAPQVYAPLMEALSGLRRLQPSTSFSLQSVTYELKRRFPTAIRDAGFKTMLEYVYGAQAQGLVEVIGDITGSVYVQVSSNLIRSGLSARSPAKSTLSMYSLSTDKSQAESSAMPSSDIHIHHSREKFEPLVSVLHSLRKHSLYKVTLTPLALAVDKMFPNAMTRFGITNIDTYVAEAQVAGLVITGRGANGKTWVSLPEDALVDNESTTPTSNNTMQAVNRASQHIGSTTKSGRVSDFSRLLRSVRALSSPGHERVLCSRVGMMLNKEDYRAMNVENFSQCLVAAAKANLIVHGGFGGSAWVALKAPQVAGVSSGKTLEEPRSRLIKISPPEIATNPVVPSGSAYKLPLTEADIEPFKPLITILRSFIHGKKRIAEPFRTVIERNLLKARPDILEAANCNTMDEYILRAQSYGLIAQIGFGNASRLRLLENSGLLSR